MQRTDSLADIEKGVKNKWVWGWCESPDANGDYFASATRKLATETGVGERTETTCQEASAHQYAASRAGFSNAGSSF